MKNTGTKINVNHGMNEARIADRQAISGPAINAVRAPKRSRTKPLIGMPAKRPTESAVINCAAVPGVMAKCLANTGIVGTTIAHMPAISVLV